MPLRPCFIPRISFLLTLVLAWSAAVDGQAAGSFVPTGSMAVPRVWHQATLLRNGMVLITGTGTPNAELYDPELGKIHSDGQHGGGPE